MLKTITLGLKLIGLYFAYSSINYFLKCFRYIYENKMIDNDSVNDSMLIAFANNFVLFGILALFFLFKPNKIISFLFKSEINSEVKEKLTLTENATLALKFLGVFLMLKSAILILSWTLFFMFYYTDDFELNKTIISSLLINNIDPFLKFIIGVILFKKHSKLGQWLNK